MDPRIRTKLLSIAHDFCEALKLETQVLDIQLTGSLANYNWTRYSDFDLHIIIDFSSIDQNIELVKAALDGKRYLWNERFPVVIEGHDVECYVQDFKEQHVSSGLFSILRDGWITQPKHDPPQVDERDVREKVRAFKADVKEAKKRSASVKGQEAKAVFDLLKRLKAKLGKDRQEGLSREGEFSVENLVFKQLRNDGTIGDLIEAIGQAYANIYVD